MKDSPSDKAQPVGKEGQAHAPDQQKQVDNWKPASSFIPNIMAGWKK